MQGLAGKQWNGPVTDSEAAALLRQDPNFVQGSLSDPELQVRQIVSLMTAVVKHSEGDPIIAAAWRDAWDRFRGVTFGDEIQCAWWYAKYLVKFVHHSELLRDWMFSLDDTQLLISPDALLRMRAPKGDCAIFTTLIQALLSYRGISYETVTVAVNPAMPDFFGHVYPQAVRADGSRIALDASHGKYPGWEVPAARILKKKCGMPMVTKSQAMEAVN